MSLLLGIGRSNALIHGKTFLSPSHITVRFLSSFRQRRDISCLITRGNSGDFCNSKNHILRPNQFYVQLPYASGSESKRGFWSSSFCYHNPQPFENHAKNKNQENNIDPSPCSHSHTHTHVHEHHHDDFQSPSNLIFGHSHSHTGIDTNLIEEIERSKACRNVAWLGLFTNVGMAIMKGAGGIIFHSHMLVADAVHTLSDCCSDILTLSTVSISRRPKSDLFPNGYGKIESLGAICISGILIAAGVGIGLSSLTSGLEPFIPHGLFEVFSSLGHSHSHSHSHVHIPDALESLETNIDINAAWVALASMVLKEAVFRKTLKVAKENHSGILIANAWHHRADALTASVTLLTICGSYHFGANWLDAFGGLIVSSLVLKAGIMSLKSSLGEITDKTLEVTDNRFKKISTSLEKIINDINKQYNDFYKIEEHLINIQIKSINVFVSGPNLISNITLIIPNTLSTSFSSLNNLTAHDVLEISKAIKQKLQTDIYGLRNVTVEFESETR